MSRHGHNRAARSLTPGWSIRHSAFRLFDTRLKVDAKAKATRICTVTDATGKVIATIDPVTRKRTSI